MTKILSLEERFLSHVSIHENHNDCWEWTGGKFHNKYGQFGINRKHYYAHRVSYALFVDMIPDGMEVCHSCDNPGCVNPKHLFLGTHQENINDKVRKNRQAKGENQGRHKLSEQNIYQIREMLEQDYTQQEIANIFGVSQVQICHIKSGGHWEWLK